MPRSAPSPQPLCFFNVIAARPPRSVTSSEMMAALPPRPKASFTYAFTYLHLLLMLGVT
jgi:hypothetical protein